MVTIKKVHAMITQCIIWQILLRATHLDAKFLLKHYLYYSIKRMIDYLFTVIL